VIGFDVKQRSVVLEYEPELNVGWVRTELNTHRQVTISRAFTFKKSDLISGPSETEDEEIDEPVFRFRLATRKDGYFRIAGRILGIANDVLIVDQGVTLERKLFVAERNIGIFRRIAKVKQDDGEIVVGGDREDSIPIDVFRELLDRFPSSGEIDRYASARVETIIGEFFDGMKSARDNYEVYLSKRKSSVSDKPLEQERLLQAEIDKFAYLRDTISAWLEKADTYSERDWQRMIIKVILLIFPKYVAVLENVEIADFYSSPDRTKKRYIDLCLVDAGGNIDVIEIKKPFDNAILSKSRYRDNSLPARELSGSIMQAEKYIFHLSKWGVAGERALSKRYGAELPTGMSIRITNPKAMIILGRDRLSSGQQALSATQMLDLEVIKRKYANMMDILTYDDLLRRLENIIASLSQRKTATGSRRASGSGRRKGRKGTASTQR
jgi:hypothetical protein